MHNTNLETSLNLMYGALDDEKKMEVRLIERDGRPVDQGDSRRG